MLKSSDEFWDDEHETFYEPLALETAEPVIHIRQLSNGVEPSEICPSVVARF